MPGEPSRILILSDLHAYEDLGNRAKAPSALHFSGAAPDVDRMFSGVVEALADADIHSVDAVLCAGDMTDRAEPAALERVWQKLTNLAAEVDAPLIATAGNHDYSSHSERKDVDPKETLIDLEPLFPVGDEDGHKNYFAYAVAVKDVGDMRFVSFNSCANHGLTFEDAPEYQHGRVTKSALKRVKDAFTVAPRPQQNVLLTHHHPIQLPYFDTLERSQMLDSGLLLKELEDDAPWLIVHGHKHRPWLHYAHGGGDSPTIFSAGSFSADLGGDDFGGSLRNQFYLMEVLSPADADDLGLSMAGTIRAWSRVPFGEKAWTPAGPKDGMSYQSGFGWRVGPNILAKRITEWLATQTGDVTMSDLLSWEPRLSFVTPNDLDGAFRMVSGYEVKRNEAGSVTGIEKADG